jgi:hypothetical protein
MANAKNVSYSMIYKTFSQWKNGKFLEHFGSRKENYSNEELDLIEMGWKYGHDAGLEARQKKWTELTDEEIDEIAVSQDHEIVSFARAIEAKLKEKNT